MFNLSLRPARPRVGFMIYIGLETVMLGGAILWIINDRRRAQRARARMHGAELERIAAEKRSIESDLQALQARVEPQFLFNTLAQVKELYEQSAERGERMLDELIAYLRAAMPKMRDTSSTVGQELDLVRAYLAIVKVRLGDRLTYEIESRPPVAEMRMPSMMLLPLVDHAIAHGLAEARATRSIFIRTAITDDRVQLEVADSGVGFLPGNEGESIADIRERLSALYVDRADLALRRRAEGGSEAALTIPCEAVEALSDAA